MPELELLFARLRNFIAYFYDGELKYFAKYSGITTGVLESFLNEGSPRVPSVEHVFAFEKAGLNKIWLQTGEGSVFAENKAGEELRKHYLNTMRDKLSINSEIIKTVLKNNRNQTLTIKLEDLLDNQNMLDVIAERVSELILTKQEPLLRF